MPYPETDYRFQNAVIWDKVDIDEYNNPIVAAARNICMRWEDTEQETINSKGDPIKLVALVITAEELVIGSILWKGKLASLPATTELTDLLQVITYWGVPDVKNRVSRRTYGLQRYTDELPTVQS
jgi:hypothetical protein